MPKGSKNQAKRRADRIRLGARRRSKQITSKQMPSKQITIIEIGSLPPSPNERSLCILESLPDVLGEEVPHGADTFGGSARPREECGKGDISSLSLEMVFTAVRCPSPSSLVTVLVSSDGGKSIQFDRHQDNDLAVFFRTYA